MAEALPHLFRDVRRKRRQHADQRLEGFARQRHVRGGCFAALFNRLVERIDFVGQLHQRRDAGVQMQPLLEVLGDGADNLMHAAAQLPLVILQSARRVTGVG